MPWIRNKILIDRSLIEARLDNLLMLSEEMQEMGLLTSPEGQEFDKRFKELCYPFQEGMNELERDMLAFVNTNFKDKKIVP